jgi:hypothetical protein
MTVGGISHGNGFIVLRKGLPGKTEQPTDQEDRFHSNLSNSFCLRRSGSLCKEKDRPGIRNDLLNKSAAEAVNS